MRHVTVTAFAASIGVPWALDELERLVADETKKHLRENPLSLLLMHHDHIRTQPYSPGIVIWDGESS